MDLVSLMDACWPKSSSSPPAFLNLRRRRNNFKDRGEMVNGGFKINPRIVGICAKILKEIYLYIYYE